MAIIINKIIIMEEFILNTFGERFKSIRLSKDLTQEQLVLWTIILFYHNTVDRMVKVLDLNVSTYRIF